MKRRSFLKYSAASAAAMAMGGTSMLSWTPRAHAATIYKTFYITEGFIEQPDGVDVYFQGFSSSSGSLNVPGESMIVQEGDTVRVTIYNTTGRSHSFVIDGMVDSGRISPGSAVTVSFTARNPGTHMYYDGRNAPYNRLTGLHGGLAVMPSGSDDELYDGSPTFKYQKFWIFNDIDPNWHNAVRFGNTPNSTYTPRYFTINGLSGRPPGAPGNGDPNIDAMHNHDTALHGHVGDRTLLRIINPGLCQAAVHTHANHMEWLTENGNVRPDVWLKDIIYLEGDKGRIDAIFPYDAPPDAWPPVSLGAYPMHLHTEMTQTAGGGLYMFGAMTDIFFE